MVTIQTKMKLNPLRWTKFLHKLTSLTIYLLYIDLLLLFCCYHLVSLSVFVCLETIKGNGGGANRRRRRMRPRMRLYMRLTLRDFPFAKTIIL